MVQSRPPAQNRDFAHQSKALWGRADPTSVSGKLSWAGSRSTSDNALFRAVLTQLLEPSETEKVRKKYFFVDHDRIPFAKPVLALLAARAEQIEVVRYRLTRQNQSR